MTATGTPGRALATRSRTEAAVAPSSSARREASWMTGPSMTGSENGIPTSIASAPAPASPWRNAGVTSGRPPVAYATKARPPASTRLRRTGSSSTTAVGQRGAHRVEVLVAPAGQADQHRGALGERPAEEPPDHVGRFQRREDPLGPGQRLEALEGVRVVGA